MLVICWYRSFALLAANSCKCTQSELARRLTELVVKTAAGQPTKSEAQGHHEFFVPYKYQEKQVAFKRACEE